MHGEHTRAKTPQLHPGEVFADHRIEGILGQGGMGVVYRAIDLRLNRQVALKIIKPELSLDDDFRRRFRRESELAASVRQPNVVTIYQAGDSDGLLYVTMELIDGVDLRAVISQHNRLDLMTATEVATQVAAALDAAHASGLVHRDVKPANVLVSTATPMHVYLTDFGLTKRTSSQSGLTKTGLFVGTLDYAAPEQIQGWPVDARADVYALGCVLFEMLTGRPPFRRDNDYATLYAHMTDPPPSPRSFAPDLPPAFDAVIARALAKSADDRYPSAGDLARAAVAAASGAQPVEPERTVAIGPAAPAPATGTHPAEAGPTRLDPAPMPVTPPPAQAPMAPPPPQQPPSHVTNVLPPSRPARNPWPAVVLGVAVIAVAAAIAIVLILSGGDDETTSGPQGGVAATQAPTGSEQPPPPADAELRSDVRELGSILDLSAEGRAATAQGEFETAATNRQAVLDKLGATPVDDELQDAHILLRDAITASLESNRAHLECGNCARATQADTEATRLKREFATEFNPYAQQYLGRSYDPDEF